MTVTCNSTDIPADQQRTEPNWSVLIFLLRCCLLLLGVVANGWVLRVSWGPTRITGVFKYPLCNLAFWDGLTCVASLAQLTTVLLAPPNVLLFLRDHQWLCRCYYLAIYLAAMGMFGALLVCPTQRLLLLSDDCWLAACAEVPTVNCAFIGAVSAVYSVPPVLLMFGPATGCADSFCGRLPVMKTVAIASYSLIIIGYTTAIVETLLAVRKILQMRQMFSEQHQQQNWKEHRDIILTIIWQTATPLLLSLPLIGYSTQHRLRAPLSSGVGQKLAFACLQLNPLMDALATTVGIKDYRRLAKRWLPFTKPAVEENEDIVIEL